LNHIRAATEVAATVTRTRRARGTMRSAFAICVKCWGGV
jgi:hypothetical protein